MLERFRLDHKVAIVSGGGRGIGRGIALALAEAGADVVCSARSTKQIEAVAQEVQDLGRRGLAVQCDVNQSEQLDLVVDQTLAAFERVDILVNVAGGTMPAPALQVSEQVFADAFHFNVTAAFLLSQRVIRHMLAGEGGVIVNISSALSHLVDSGFVAYGTAKAALSHMTRLMAFEFAPRVRINGLSVGAVETEALAPFLSSGDLKAKMEEMTPMGRLGTTEDIALAALYLASPASSWVTGKVFEVDGGTVASNWPLKFPPP